MNKQRVFAFLAVLALFAAPAMAGSVTLSNGSQTGMAEWDLDGGDLVIKLYNLTEAPYDAVDLLTGFRFCLIGADDAGPIEEATADAVWISDDGEITATASDVDLLNAPETGKPTWSLVDGTSCFELRFNPDAMYAIIGPVDPSTGDYSTANPGAIPGNPGHNPFADQMATFRLSLDNLDASAFGLDKVAFLFGTDFEVVVVPLPASAWLGFALLGTMGVVQIVRRRRRASLI